VESSAEEAVLSALSIPTGGGNKVAVTVTVTVIVIVAIIASVWIVKHKPYLPL
jgi:hypothetical protein